MIRRLRGGPRLAAVAALSLALTAAGCSSPEDSGSDGSTAPSSDIEFGEGYRDVAEPAGEPTEGGELVVTEYTEARTLNPTQTIGHGSSGGNALASVYDVLVRYDQAEGDFEPWLAESLEANEDHTEWTLTLRDEVTFSDGSPVDAKAVIGSIGYYMENRGSDAGFLATYIEGMKPADERTVVFQLRQSWSSFPYMLARGAGMIMAPAAYSGSEFEPIGAGPFVLENYSPGESLVVTRRDDYWNGTPHLEKVRFTWLESDQARLDVLNSGAADVAYLREGPQVWEAVEKYAGYMHLLSLGDLLQINNREERPGADPRVREAIALAFDPTVLYQRAQEGKGLPVTKVFGEESKWFNESIEARSNDVAAARKLVDEAKAEGFDGKLQYVGGAGPVGRAEALSIKAMLEQAGFTVEVEYLRTIADRIEKMYVTHEFDIAKGGGGVTEVSPFEGLYSMLSSQSFLNSSGYASQEMDALLAELQGAATDEERTEVLAEIERLFVDDVPVVNVGTKASYYPWQEDVHGVFVSADQILLLGEAWVQS